MPSLEPFSHRVRKSVQTQSPIIVTGVARGGTSLIASLCAHMGVSMGKSGPRYENPYLQHAVLEERWDVVALLIEEIRAAYPQWGWKLPALVDHLPRVADMIPDARFIFVSKDIVSLAKRPLAKLNSDRSDSAQFCKIIYRRAKKYATLAHFGATSNRSVLFLSYEETVKNLPETIEEIARYCHISMPNVEDVQSKVRADGVLYKSGVYTPRPITDVDLRLGEICRAAGMKFPSEVEDGQPADW